MIEKLCTTSATLKAELYSFIKWLNSALIVCASNKVQLNHLLAKQSVKNLCCSWWSLGVASPVSRFSWSFSPADGQWTWASTPSDWFRATFWLVGDFAHRRSTAARCRRPESRRCESAFQVLSVVRVLFSENYRKRGYFNARFKHQLFFWWVCFYTQHRTFVKIVEIIDRCQMWRAKL